MYDLVIVGMGSAGITAARFASRLDLKVAVVERGQIGGDSLWTGSVPSKALLAAAKTAQVMRTADRFGIDSVEPEIDRARVWRRIRAVRAEIASADNDPAGYRDVGVDVVIGEATVTSGTEVVVAGDDGLSHTLATRFVLICTGSHPTIPTIAGLTPRGILTSDTLFELDEPPSSIAVIGGGPMGTEMAQALRRLGIEVTLFQRARSLLPREEPTLVERLTRRLIDEGVIVHCTADVRRLEPTYPGTLVHAVVGDAGVDVAVPVEGVLLAAGRSPNVDGLGLAELGITLAPNGIVTDERGRTTIRTIYAVGDVAGRRMLANTAGLGAVVAVRDMFFPGRGAADAEVPWCTFTDPELAHVGLTVREAEDLHGTDTDVWRFEFSDNDRARADDATEGGIVVVTAKGKIVGAHVLAPAAGELIHELALAVNRQLRVDELAELAHVYPTLSSGIGQLATEAAYEKAHRLRWLMKRR